MRTAKWIIGAVGALALVLTLLLGVLPSRGQAIVGFEPPGTEITGDVDCGSEFRRTRWSKTEGCEGAFLGQTGLIVLVGFIGVAATMQQPGFGWRTRIGEPKEVTSSRGPARSTRTGRR